MPSGDHDGDAAAPWPSVGGPLDEVNELFHDSYGQARARAEDEAPIFVLLGDALYVVRRGETQTLAVTPRAFHVLKSAAHAPIALYAALLRGGEGAPHGATRAALERLRAALDAALERLPGDLDAGEMAGDARAALEGARAFLARALPSGVTRAALDEYARAAGPGLLRLTEHASEVQLVALHAAVETALAPLDERERRALQVVVAGDHQARERSLAMQYFRKRLGEPAGAEERLAYAEGTSALDEALALVGTRRLDRAVARAFFGDDKRLQRDVLGDAAAAKLEPFTPEPLPGPPRPAPPPPKAPSG